MTETFVAHVNGSHVCYRTQTGIDKAFIGCTHSTPREAIDHTTREEVLPDARIPADRLRPEMVNPADVIPTSRSAPSRATPSTGGEWDNGAEQTEAPGQPPADGPRRPALTGTFPPGPVGAPDLGLVP